MWKIKLQFIFVVYIIFSFVYVILVDYFMTIGSLFKIGSIGRFGVNILAELNSIGRFGKIGRGVFFWPSWGTSVFFWPSWRQLGQKNVGRVFVNMFGKIGRGVLFWPSLVYILDDSAKKFGAESGSLAESSAPHFELRLKPNYKL